MSIQVMRRYKQCYTVKVRYEGKGREKREKTKEVEEEIEDHVPYPTSCIEQRTVTFLSLPIGHVEYSNRV